MPVAHARTLPLGDVIERVTRVIGERYAEVLTVAEIAEGGEAASELFDAGLQATLWDEFVGVRDPATGVACAAVVDHDGSKNGGRGVGIGVWLGEPVLRGVSASGGTDATDVSGDVG